MSIIDDLATLVCECGPRGKDWRRLRLAVTPAEYVEIREYMLKTYGEFWAKIMGISLVITDNIEEPNAVEFSWDTMWTKPFDNPELL